MDRMATNADFEILAEAQSDTRIVLTKDKDFGDIAVHAGLPAECGVILLRESLQAQHSAEVREYVEEQIKQTQVIIDQMTLALES